MIKKNKNGLPLEIKYCKKCNLINQRPTTINEYFHTKDTVQTTVEFDDNGVCAGCNFVKKEFDGTIDWKEREKELQELCDKHRKNNGEYDCIVPDSRKDSVFASYILKYKYKMNPLQSLGHHMYTEIDGKIFKVGYIKAVLTTIYIPNPKFIVE